MGYLLVIYFFHFNVVIMPQWRTCVKYKQFKKKNSNILQQNFIFIYQKNVGFKLLGEIKLKQ